MQRTVLGILLGIGFLAAIVLVTLDQARVRCEVCMVFGGRRICEEAIAVDRREAVLQATTSACSRLSSGVTAGLQCNATPPVSVECSE